MQNRLLCPLFLVVLLVLAACSNLSLDDRRAASLRLVGEIGWQRLNLDAGPFVLEAFVPPDLNQTNTLTIYIEGDGLAWIDSSTPSFDPTPLDPLALRLALRQPSGAVAYLARPCQYVSGDNRHGCESKYWTSHRFAPEVIDASNQAVSQLMQRFGAEHVELVGYSGGGAIATLVAARRKDVIRLITVAGNLDHEVWTRINRASPLTGSLNPAAQWRTLVSVPQLHFVGGQDNNVPFEVSKSYQSRFPESQRPDIQIVDGFDHTCCWVEKWPEIYLSASGRPVTDNWSERRLRTETRGSSPE